MARGKIEKRGQRRRKTKPVILIVTEGSQTEPKYFEHYRNRQTNIDIRVVGSRTSGGETDYLSPVSYTHLDVYKRQTSYFAPDFGAFFCRYTTDFYRSSLQSR